MLFLTDKGLYCEAGDFYIDPNKAVDTALITHAHSDHARRGSKRYVCVKSGEGLLRHRLGRHIQVSTVTYGEVLQFGKVQVSFHPAGHILGSAQIRIDDGKEVWVVSGDYKRDLDPTCEPFEPIPCDVFITEATFGNPSYCWEDTGGTVQQIHEWWEENRKKRRNSVLFCYALGKTQRVLAELARFTDQRVLLFGEANPMTECYRREGIRMVPTQDIESLSLLEPLAGELVVAPHSLSRSPWMNALKGAETAFASGWMQTGAFGVRSRYDRGFALSDHADWNALLRTIRETGAKKILVQHQSDGSLVNYLRRKGWDAAPLVRARAGVSAGAVGEAARGAGVDAGAGAPHDAKFRKAADRTTTARKSSTTPKTKGRRGEQLDLPF